MNDLILSSPMPALSLPAAGAPIQLSRRAKAAVVVRLLLNEGADIPLEDLPEELQSHLTKAMGQMRTVDRDTLSAVVSEFAAEVERIGLRFPGGIAGALNALEGKISPQTAERLRKEAGVRQAGDPWVRIRDMGADKLLPVLQSESIEVCAVVMSKLEVKKAAALLGLLPGPRARQITYAVSLTGSVTTDAVERIGLSLAMLREVDPADLLIAMAGAEAAGMKASADFILENMSGRMADSLREEMQETAAPKPADHDTATSNMVAAIRKLEAEGELILMAEEEE